MYFFIKNDQNDEFVTQTYREVVENKDLLSRANFLKTFSGNFIYTHTDNDYTHMVFSEYPGCLLAETLWEKLQKPKYTLYIQWLQEHKKFLCLCINDYIISDKLISLSKIIEELDIHINSQSIKKIIYLQSDKTKEIIDELRNDFPHLDFEELPNNPINELRIHSSFFLAPIEEALEQNKNEIYNIIKTKLFIVVGIVIAYFIVSSLYRYLSIQSQPQAIEQPKPITNTFDLNQQISQITDLLYQFVYFPGWKAKNLVLTEKSVDINIEPLIKTVPLFSSLQHWIAKNNATVVKLNETLRIFYTANKSTLHSKRFISRKRLHNIQENIIINNPNIFFEYKIINSLSEIQGTLQFKGAHISDLESIQRLFAPYVAWIKQGNLSFTKNKLVGSIIISIKGKA